MRASFRRPNAGRPRSRSPWRKSSRRPSPSPPDKKAELRSAYYTQLWRDRGGRAKARPLRRSLDLFGPRGGGEDFGRRGGGELLEVVAELAREFVRLRNIRGFVGPRVARVEDLGRHARHARGHFHVEYRIRSEPDAVELSADRRIDHRARVGELHALADAIRSAAPTGVDEPAPHVVPCDPLAEHLRVDDRFVHHERGAEAVRERRLRFGDALFGAGDLRGVAGEEVI